MFQEQTTVMNSTFASKLPEKAMTEDTTEAFAQPVMGKMISVVYDGDFCTNKEDAYQKFRERQIKDAMYGGGQQFF